MFGDYLKDKAVGFWFSVSIAALSLITSIVYAVCYAGSDDMNWVSFALMAAAAVAAVVLIVLKRFEWAAYAQAALIFLSLLFFIYGIYYYVSVVLVGIDLDSFSAEFWVCTVLYALCFGLGVANVFLKQTKNGGEAK